MNRLPPAGQHGFTFIEVLCAVAMAAILASIAYPSYLGVVHKLRRSEAQAALLKLQMAQERYRADHMAYGGLSDLGIAASTAAGLYSLAMVAPTESSYQAVASATGAQRRDTACRYMTVTVDGMNVSYASGTDASASNPDAVNRRCWGI